MSINWTHDLELMFLELYQCYPIIWDPKEPGHKDRFKVYDAWKMMSKKLDIPVKDLKNKKDSLMCTFRMHKRKITGGGDVHTPVWFAFNTMDSFLGDVVICKTKNITLPSSQSGKKTPTTTTHEINDRVRSQGQQESQETNTERDDSSSAESDNLETIRRGNAELKAIQGLKQSLNDFNKAIQNELNKKTFQEEEDECDIYGKLLAIKLKKLPENDRIRFMYEVDGIFLRRFSRANFGSSSVNYHVDSPSPPVEGRLSPVTYSATSPPQLRRLSQKRRKKGRHEDLN